MTKQTPAKSKRKLTGPQVRARYGNISAMTLHRWVQKGIFPKPIIISGKMYFDEDELDENDRLLASQPYTVPKNILAAREARRQSHPKTKVPS